MKKVIIISSILVSILKNSFCQNIIQSHIDISKKDIVSYYILKLEDGSEIKTKDLLVNFNKLIGLQIVKHNDIKQYYDGKDKVDIVYIFKLKPGVKLLNLKQIFNTYKIAPQYQEYNVLDDDMEVSDKNNLWAAVDDIQEVLIFPTQRYIDIRMKNYKNFKELQQKSIDNIKKNAEEYKATHIKQ